MLLYMSSRLSKIRSVHTYVMPRTVYFGWICIADLKVYIYFWRKNLDATYIGIFFYSEIMTLGSFLKRASRIHRGFKNSNAIFKKFQLEPINRELGGTNVFWKSWLTQANCEKTLYFQKWRHEKKFLIALLTDHLISNIG